MEISIRGKNKRISKKEIKYMLNYFASILLGKRLSKNIYLRVDFKSLGPALWGLSSPLHDEDGKQREFSILVDPKISRSRQIKTFAHEMVHIMQYARGELKLLHGDDYKWMGKKVTISDKHYRKMPWEKEAWKSEKYLSQFYKDHLKLNNVKFTK